MSETCICVFVGGLNDETKGGVCDAWRVGLITLLGISKLGRVSQGYKNTPHATPATVLMSTARSRLSVIIKCIHNG